MTTHIHKIGEMTMYKVYEVEEGYQIYWCPSAPIHYNDRIPYDGKVYSKRQAAYRKAKQLTDRLAAKSAAEGRSDSAKGVQGSNRP